MSRQECLLVLNQLQLRVEGKVGIGLLGSFFDGTAYTGTYKIKVWGHCLDPESGVLAYIK